MRRFLAGSFLVSLLAAAVVAPHPSSGKEKEGTPPGAGLSYAWASQRIDGALWGVARGDVDGDGQPETLLLERRRVRIGGVEGQAFKETGTCPLPGAAEGARISVLDLTGDGRAEIVVSAVEEGIPASAILTLDEKGCRPIVERSRWSLRVADGKLLGQGWVSSAFFFGPIMELSLKGGSLTATGKLDLPRGTRLFQFATMASDDGVRVALIKGYESIEVREQRGRKFKRIWRSPGRYGGSTNALPASQRDVLGSESSQTVTFDTPPVAQAFSGRTEIVAVRSLLPLREVIGRKPGVSGSRLVQFENDPALGFLPQRETVELPGCIVDAIPGGAPGAGGGAFLVITHPDCGMFENPTQSQIVSFRFAQ